MIRGLFRVALSHTPKQTKERRPIRPPHPCRVHPAWRPEHPPVWLPLIPCRLPGPPGPGWYDGERRTVQQVLGQITLFQFVFPLIASFVPPGAYDVGDGAEKPCSPLNPIKQGWRGKFTIEPFIEEKYSEYYQYCTVKFHVYFSKWMWYTICEEGRGRSPKPYFRFFLDLLDLLSRFVFTIRQMAVTIASSASERSLIISLADSFICVPPFFW